MVVQEDGETGAPEQADEGVGCVAAEGGEGEGHLEDVSRENFGRGWLGLEVVL